MPRYLSPFLFVIVTLSFLACSTTAQTSHNSLSQETAQPTVETPLPVTEPPEILPEPSPATYSQIITVFEQPLASGISVPEIVDRVLPCIVEIRTNTGGGTGFVLTEDGVVVTNNHVMQGNTTAQVRFTSGQVYTATLTKAHPTLDLAYLAINSTKTFQPVYIGDANNVRVGEQVVVIGFPIGSAALGQAPTVHTGIISAKRDGMLQTDAPLNPGNSGGPMLDAYGHVIGVIKSRIDESEGVTIAGIGFAIPINQVDVAIPAQVVPTPLPSALVPTAQPTDTPPPVLAPTIDIAATKAAIDAQIAIAQTKVAHDRKIERQRQEAEAYAVSAAATAVAQIPTSTPRPTSTPTPIPTATPIPPTPTPMPTSTPHPATFCRQWESMILEWIKLGNNYPPPRWDQTAARPPQHPVLSNQMAQQHCIQNFPSGQLKYNGGWSAQRVGSKAGQLLPGTYRYMARNGDDRVGQTPGFIDCTLLVNGGEENYSRIDMELGQPFEFQFHTYHGLVSIDCGGFMYRIGD